MRLKNTMLPSGRPPPSEATTRGSRGKVRPSRMAPSAQAMVSAAAVRGQRGVDDTEHGDAAAQECNRHGCPAFAAEEVGRAVVRVDQPAERAAGAGAGAGLLSKLLRREQRQ